MAHILSKSSFITGCQCAKALWLSKNRRDLIPALVPALQAIFDQGREFGKLAHSLFPGGVDVSPESHFHYDPSIEETKRLIEQGAPAIYEASFRENEVLVAVDILQNAGDGWNAFEVKSSTSIKKVYIIDVAVQYWVMNRAGLKIRNISVILVNNQYVRRGIPDHSALFKLVPVLDEVLALQSWIGEAIEELKAVANSETEPGISIGTHCSDPYVCQFMDHCWSHIPEYSVFDISRIGKKAWELYRKGIMNTVDIPEGFKLSDRQQIQVGGDKTGGRIFNAAAISEFLGGIRYPIRFLDFESVMPLLPMFDESRPYQQLVFQFSLHQIGNENSEIEHFEFLAESAGKDPRLAVLNELRRTLGKSGSIVVYNQQFEITRLNEMARDFPEFAVDINGWIKRIIDLMSPFRAGDFYLPAMRGSYSIKKVLPALFPEMNYDDLEIREGGTASLTFLQMMTGEFTGDLSHTRNALKEYCKMDTLAMVRIWQKLMSSD